MSRSIGSAWVAAAIVIAALPASARAEKAAPIAGRASYYDKHYDGKTAAGERYDPEKFTAAHRTLPFGTKLRVTDVRTGRSVSVIVNDRGPFMKDRVLDLSFAAAQELKIIARGVAQVRAEIE